MTNILIVPDSHAHFELSNERFTWLGNMIIDLAPDIVVNLGDLADMPSLSSYDKGMKAFEGKRYKHDIAIVQDALQRIDKPFIEYNEKRKNIRKGQRKPPRKVITLGNHEFRINRAVERQAELEGIISVDDLKYKEHGYEVVPFKKPIEIEGIWFCHYFASGVKGEAISGFNIASNLIAKNMVSSIVGHAHLWDMAVRAKPNGQKVIGLCAGWYGEQPTFTDATEQMWSSGVTLLKDVHEGVYDVEFYSISRIKRLYS